MSVIWTCPDCDGDLEQFDGTGLWCDTCQHYENAAIMDDPDDWRDRMIDDRDGNHASAR